MTTAFVTEHAVCALPADHRDWRHLVIRVQRRGSSGVWVLRHGGFYFSSYDNVWSPNVEDAIWFNEQSAIEAAEQVAPLTEVNGLTAADLMERT